MRQADLEIGRLGHDGGIHGVPPDEIRRAQAAVLLVGDRRDHQITTEPDTAIDQRLHRSHTRGQAPLHVMGASAVQPPATHDRGEWIRHPVDADRIGMAVEHQRTTAPRAGKRADGCRAARLRLMDGRAEPHAGQRR